MSRHALTYRAARRNIVFRETNFGRKQWPRFRLFDPKTAQLKAVVDFLKAARRAPK
jgi:hypothetical protein